MGLARDVGRVPVVSITGYLGVGKTTLLNHLLAQPGARIGVVVNDFGAVNVDAALIAGQIDEAAAISGGCVCCMEDADGLDAALERLSDTRLRLDAIVVEASGIADPIRGMVAHSGPGDWLCLIRVHVCHLEQRLLDVVDIARIED